MSLFDKPERSGGKEKCITIKRSNIQKIVKKFFDEINSGTEQMLFEQMLF
jgi:hypothetical protein